MAAATATTASSTTVLFESAVGFFGDILKYEVMGRSFFLLLEEGFDGAMALLFWMLIGLIRGGILCLILSTSALIIVVMIKTSMHEKSLKARVLVRLGLRIYFLLEGAKSDKNSTKTVLSK